MNAAIAQQNDKGGTTSEAIVIPQKWLNPVRIAVAANVIIHLLAFIYGMPHYVNQLSEVCTEEVAADCWLQLTESETVALGELGLSMQTYGIYQTGVEVIFVLLMTAMIAAIWRSRSHTWIGMVTVLALIALGVDIANVALAGAEQNRVIGIAWATALSMAMAGGLVLLPFIFPTGQFAPRWTRILVLWGLFPLAMVLNFVSWLHTFGALSWLDSNQAQILSIQVIVPSMLGGIIVQIIRYRRYYSRQQKQQTKWIIAGFVMLLLSIVTWTAMVGRLSTSDTVNLLLMIVGMPPITFLGIGAIPIALTVAILRYRLWDINFIINRSLVYAATTAVLIAIFIPAYIGLRAIWEVLLGPDLAWLAALLPAIFILLIFNPTRERLRHMIDRRVYGIEVNYTQAGNQAAASSVVKETVGAYEHVELIGRGGMGDVYKSEDSTTKQVVAIKVLSTRLAGDVETEKRFLREAQATAKLDHPNIVKIHSVGEMDDQLYIAMEYINGRDWGEILKTDGAQPFDVILPRLRELASALDYAHTQGIVHRDIKPSNVMIEADRAVLMDFGIAKIASAMTALTGSGQMVGTLDYISPEQVQGASDVGHRADIYSFGAMTYHLLAGELPFKKNNPGAKVMAHLMEPPPDVSDKVAGLDWVVGEAIQQAMAKQPTDRFASVSAFVDALSEAD